MNESFLHFIWFHQYFSKNDLRTTDGIPVSVISPGNYNLSSGPDFSLGKILMGGLEWTGPVEIHINAADWYYHKHQHDPSYDPVILHVVWDNNKQVFRKDGSVIPTIELKNRISPHLLGRANRLFFDLDSIPCGKLLASVQVSTIQNMLSITLKERLEQNSERILEVLKETEKDWNETTYRLLARNFGFRLNAEPFKRTAEIIPYKTLARHFHHEIQLEALLFGTGGFLNSSRLQQDTYYQQLVREYHFLRRKYGLNRKVDLVQWKFGRLRPANFPTIRMAQFSAVLTHTQTLFSKILNTDEPKDLINIFRVAPSGYWRDHYRFGERAKGKISGLGKTSCINIVINTVVPLIYTYGRFIRNDKFMNKAFTILNELDPENNGIVRRFEKVGFQAKNAAQTQGLYMLFRTFCQQKKCLQCKIGTSIFNQAP